MLGHHPVTEPLVESAVARKLAPHADPHLAIARRRGISVSPFHQRPPDALTPVGGVDRDPPNMQVAGRSLEPEPADRSALDGRERSPVARQVVADIGFGLFERPTGRMEGAVAGEGPLRQAVEIGGAVGTAEGNPQAGSYAAFTAATSLVSESFASPKSMSVFGSYISSLSMPAKPGRMLRFMKTIFFASSAFRIGMP